MENILFKISYPAEFHAQTAVEAAMILNKKLASLGKTSDDIASVKIRTHEACIRIIDKKGELKNPADRDHTIQYMVAIPLIFGRLTARDYEDDVASDPRIDKLREKINCIEDKAFSADYHDPQKRSIANAVTITLSDGTVLDEVVVEYPVGHKRRREEGIPLLKEKYQRNLARIFDPAQQKKIEELTLDYEKLSVTRVDQVMDLFGKIL
jgi:2-methylcitrate dehydratase